MKCVQNNFAVRLAQWLSIIGVFTVSTLTADDMASSPKVVIDSLGNEVAIWEVDVGDGSSWIQGAVFDGSSWSTPISVSGTQDAFLPQLVANSDGNTAAAWLFLDEINGVYSLAASMFSPISGWSTPVALSSGDENVSNNFQLKINSAGQLVIIWNSSLTSTGASVIWSSTAAFGDSWSTPVQLF